MIDSAFWRDLEARFRLLHNPTENFRALRHGRRPWVLLGANKQREAVFRALARRAGIAAGVPKRASALDGWLDLLAKNSPHSSGIVGLSGQPGDDTREYDRKIENLWLASAEYCINLATLGYELVEAATDGNVPGLRRDRYPMSSSSWLYDHNHGPLSDPKEERDYWKTHVLCKQEAVLRDCAAIDLPQKDQQKAQRKEINSALMCLSYDLAVLQANYVIDVGLCDVEAIQAFHVGVTELLEELSSFRRATGERMAIDWEDDTVEAGDLAGSFNLVEGDLRSLLDQLGRPGGAISEAPSLEHFSNAGFSSLTPKVQSSAEARRAIDSDMSGNLPDLEVAQGMAEGITGTKRNSQEPTITPPRKHGFEADMERHLAIAEIVSKHVHDWPEKTRVWKRWQKPDVLKLICAELDTARYKSALYEIPKSWKDGKPQMLNGARVNGWIDALDHAKRKKLITDHIGYSLKMVLKKTKMVLKKTSPKPPEA